jgi:hypothetical protein
MTRTEVTKQKRVDWKSRAQKAERECAYLESLYSLLSRKNQALRAVQNHHEAHRVVEDSHLWKARAERLKRALGKHCSSCVKFETGQRSCDTYNQLTDGCNKWQFDEERFTK